MKQLLRKSVLVGASFTATCALAASPSELSDLPAFVSSNHLLDLLIIARPKPVELGEFFPSAWIYEVCYRKDDLGNACPADARTTTNYGGMRLQLEPGDHLKIRLINKLPPAPPDAKHLDDPDGALLKANPTNLHTHGLIVEPRQPSAVNPTYGDYIFVYSYPKGKLPMMAVPGLDLMDQPVDYDIYLPRNHPSGLFWIHPHVHGLALNQITYGLASIITVGSPRDYLTGPSAYLGSRLDPAIPVRHLVMKDMQVLPDGSVLSQQDTQFCAPDPVNEPARNGFCPGQVYVDGQGGVHNYTEGKWFFTLNGQVYPAIHIGAQGEIWRITHASAGRTYQVSLQDNATAKPLVFQVLALDGITLDSIGGPAAVAQATAGKVQMVKCPASLAGVSNAVCAEALHMMPSARAEIWIPPQAAHVSAELVTSSYNTGPAGDTWPSARLAHLELAGDGRPSSALAVKSPPGQLVAPGGPLSSAVSIDGGPATGEIALADASRIAAKLPPPDADALKVRLRALSAPEAIASAPCAALPSGHHRRIFFGLPTGNPSAFGAGYEEVDENGNPVPGTFQDIAPFDHLVVSICLPLAPGNKTATEIWELVNVSGEDHNFHIHQTKFQVLSTTAAAAPPNALMDNVPMLRGSDACDGSVSTWRSGACTVRTIYLSIPFSQVGDFVYHCHILEHEDGGMMAHIRVVPAP